MAGRPTLNDFDSSDDDISEEGSVFQMIRETMRRMSDRCDPAERFYPGSIFRHEGQIEHIMHFARRRASRGTPELLLSRGNVPDSMIADAQLVRHKTCFLHFDYRAVETFLRELYASRMRDTSASKCRPPVLHYALSDEKYDDLIKYLLLIGANPNKIQRKDRSTALHVACGRRGDHHKLVDQLLVFTLDKYRPLKLGARDHTGRTPLDLAVRRKNRRVIRTLLRHGADPNRDLTIEGTSVHDVTGPNEQQNKRLRTTLMRICDNEAGWSPRVFMPLHMTMTMASSQTHLVERLIRGGADPDAADEDGCTALHLICRGGRQDPKLMQLVFDTCDKTQMSLEIDARDDKKRTPLHWAAYNGYMQLMELLLRRGADPTLADIKGSTALHLICRCSSQNGELMRMLFRVSGEMQHTLQVDARDRKDNTPLHWAATNGSAQYIEQLLRRGADPNLTNAEGSMALHLICNRYTVDLNSVKLLFEIGDELKVTPPVNIRDRKGRTPLHWAASNNHEQLIQLLLSRGAVANTFDEGRQTPLHAVCQKRWDYGSAARLIAAVKGCDVERMVNARDKRLSTPLLQATHEGPASVAELLLRNGADPNAADKGKRTALHNICNRLRDEDERLEFVRMLFRTSKEMGRSVRIDVRDSDLHWTPLQLAVSNSLPKLVKEFLDRGAKLSTFAYPDRLKYCADELDVKLRQASGALLVAKRLEAAGYVLQPKDALVIMQFMYGCELLEAAPDDGWWHDDETFQTLARQITIAPELTLDKLVGLSSAQTARHIDCEHYYDLASSKKLNLFCNEPGLYKNVCKHLLAKLIWRFFRKWAADRFWELTGSRLSLECCEMIVARLTYGEMFKLCQA